MDGQVCANNNQGFRWASSPSTCIYWGCDIPLHGLRVLASLIFTEIPKVGSAESFRSSTSLRWNQRNQKLCIVDPLAFQS